MGFVWFGDLSLQDNSDTQSDKALSVLPIRDIIGEKTKDCLDLSIGGFLRDVSVFRRRSQQIL